MPENRCDCSSDGHTPECKDDTRLVHVPETSICQSSTSGRSSRVDAAAVKVRHVMTCSGPDSAASCDDAWPCEVWLLADELERTQAALAAIAKLAEDYDESAMTSFGPGHNRAMRQAAARDIRVALGLEREREVHT